MILGCNRGFSLTELVVVIALIAIMLAMVSLNFSDWTKKYQIEQKTNELTAELNNLRLSAVTTKMPHAAIIDTSSYVFKRYSSDADDGGAVSSTVLSKTTSYSIRKYSGGSLVAPSGLNVSFDIGGYSSSGATLMIGPDNNSASFNCVVISTGRVKKGKWDETAKDCIY